MCLQSKYYVGSGHKMIIQKFGDTQHSRAISFPRQPTASGPQDHDSLFDAFFRRFFITGSPDGPTFRTQKSPNFAEAYTRLTFWLTSMTFQGSEAAPSIKWFITFSRYMRNVSFFLAIYSILSIKLLDVALSPQEALSSPMLSPVSSRSFLMPDTLTKQAHTTSPLAQVPFFFEKGDSEVIEFFFEKQFLKGESARNSLKFLSQHSTDIAPLKTPAKFAEVTKNHAPE